MAAIEVEGLERTFGGEERARRYPFAEGEHAAAIRSPRERWAGILMQDLGHYMRDRFARYVRISGTGDEAARVEGENYPRPTRHEAPGPG